MTKAALLFPGQGSQKVGMGADLFENVEAARAIFQRADVALGFEISTLCFQGPEEELRQTVNTQPALYVTSCAALEALRSRTEVNPFAVAGHSVGEYAALYAAGALDFESGLKLVRRRAELMNAAALRSPGAMAAVLGLDADAVREGCEVVRKETGKVLAVANYNSPGQIVISGEAEAVDRVGEVLKERGAKRMIPLQVSGAFHSPLMVSAGDALYADLRTADFQQARTPVVVNVTAEYNRTAADFPPYLTMQVSGSVRWEESMQLLLADGVDTFVELGSGDVLAGLLKRIDRTACVVSVQDTESLGRAAELLNEIAAESVGAEATAPAKTIYHIAAIVAWRQGKAAGEYRPASLESEGFIHCSTADQVEAVANERFRARHGLALLVIDARRVHAPIRYETAANGQSYPHIYGPLNVDSVMHQIHFEPGPDGRFKLLHEHV